MKIYGQALLDADTKRITNCEAVGLDETLFVRRGRFREKQYVTTIADVKNGKVIDVVESRNYVDVAQWFHDQPTSWKSSLRFGALDMSATYRAVFRELLSSVMRICDPYHVIQLMNRALDDVRRRVQNEQTGHRGRKNDPLYKIRKLLIMAKERLDGPSVERLEAQISLGDPDGEVGLAYLAKEQMRVFYKLADAEEAGKLFAIIVNQCQKSSMSPELQKLGRTLQNWKHEITNFHIAKVTNGPTEALNNLIKLVKRVGFGFRNFESYRMRILLYAGRPNWRILASISVP